MTTTKRIRTTRQAARLRPIATERARHSKFRAGDDVFYLGISYAAVTIFQIYDRKPYREALMCSVRNGSFFHGSLAHARPLRVAADA